MRWVDFARLRGMLLVAAAYPEGLTASDLIRVTNEERIMVGADGRPLSRTTHYHHRIALRRLGLLVHENRRYRLNENAKGVNTLTKRPVRRLPLNDAERVAFANAIVRNNDCQCAFFSHFLDPTDAVRDVDDFVDRARPITLDVLPRSTSQERRVVIETAEGGGQLVLDGENAVQAIYYGLRSWGVRQLGFLDEVYRVGIGHTIYPVHITARLSAHELQARMLDALDFVGDWSTVSIGAFAIEAGRRWHVPVRQVTDILLTWLRDYPNVVAGMATKEQFIVGPVHDSLQSMVLKGFLRGPDGSNVSHLRIHRGLVERATNGTEGTHGHRQLMAGSSGPER